MLCLLNDTKGTVVAEDVGLADSIWSRFRGLMGRRCLPEGHGLLLRPSSSIHTGFMRFAIDVVFLDRQNRVLKVVPEVKPFRVALAPSGVRSALELPAGAAWRAQVEPGDQLVMNNGSGPSVRPRR